MKFYPLDFWIVTLIEFENNISISVEDLLSKWDLDLEKKATVDKVNKEDLLQIYLIYLIFY